MAKVHDAGHALIDGWLLADAGPRGRQADDGARPVDLVPHRGDTSPREDGAYVADHEYRTRRVAIAWDGDRPSIGRAPEDPSQP